MKTSVRARCEQDRSVTIPGPALSRRRVADPVCGTAARVDRLQSAIGEESERTTVGRPERECGVVGAGQWVSREPVQWTHPEANRLGPDLREKRDLPAVR